MYHFHHIRPRHMGGTDDTDNLVKLTVEEHAAAHKKLWEDHGSEYDRIAWQCLVGQIDNAEANRLANIHYNKNKKVSEETKKKISLANRGKKLSMETKRKIGLNNKGNKSRAGYINTNQHNEKIATALRDKPKSEEHKESLRGKRPDVNQSGSKNNNSKKIHTPYGVFGSINEGAKHTGMTYRKFWYLLNTGRPGWNYIEGSL